MLDFDAATLYIFKAGLQLELRFNIILINKQGIMLLYLDNFPQNKHLLNLSLKKVRQETTAPQTISFHRTQ